MKLRFPILAIFIITAISILVSCSDMSTIHQDFPIKPVREYERMIVGRLDADYIGNDACLAKCHAHDPLFTDFQHSVHS